MANLSWIKCTGGADCGFFSLNTASITATDGVYIIWHTGPTPRVVRVGQGNIADRINAHRQDPQITQFKQFPMYVTWASVPAKSQRDGIERFLYDSCNPRVGERAPNVAPIAVNLPWG